MPQSHHTKSLSPLLRILLILLQPWVSMSRKVRLTYINGIATHLSHMEEGEKEITSIFGEPCIFCYNPTSQTHYEDVVGWLGDITQAGTQKLGRITEEVNSLVHHLKEALDSVGKRGVVVHIAHSQGALITSLAVRRLTPEELCRVEVLCFGGAAVLRKTKETPFRRCINYYSVNDPILYVAPSAVQYLRSGRVVGNAEEEFCFLAPRIGDPLADHDILGATYRQALNWEGARFRQEHRSLAFKMYHPLALMINAINHHIRELIKAAIRYVFQLCLATMQWVHFKAGQFTWFIRSYIVRPIVFVFMICLDAIRIWISGKERYELVLRDDPMSNDMEWKAQATG